MANTAAARQMTASPWAPAFRSVACDRYDQQGGVQRILVVFDVWGTAGACTVNRLVSSAITGSLVLGGRSW